MSESQQQKLADKLSVANSMAQKGFDPNVIKQVLGITVPEPSPSIMDQIGTPGQPTMQEFLGVEEPRSFFSAIGENIAADKSIVGDIPLIGRGLDFALSVLDLPQDIATAAIGDFFNLGLSKDEGFLERFARGQNPSEILGTGTGLLGAGADIILDPLNIIPGMGLIKARNLAKAGDAAQVAKAQHALFAGSADPETLSQLSGTLGALKQGGKARPSFTKPEFQALQDGFGEIAQRRGFDTFDFTKGGEYGLNVQILQRIHAGDMTFEDLLRQTRARGVADDRIGDLLVPSGNMGKRLEKIGRIQKDLSARYRLATGRANMSELEELVRSGNKLEPEDVTRAWWQKGTDLWRASLVSQVSTAVRNLASFGMNSGAHVIEEAFNATLQKLTGMKRTARPLDALGVMFRSTQDLMQPIHFLKTGLDPSKMKGFTSELLQKYPKQWDNFTGSFASDVVGRGDGPMQTYINSINIFNRAQEFYTRSVMFQVGMSKIAKNKGIDLAKLMKEPDWVSKLMDKVTQEELGGAIAKSLEMTFSADPKSRIAKGFIKFFHDIPGAAFVLPFPRFMLSSAKWMFEHSPFGLMKFYNLNSKKTTQEFAKMYAGDFSTISKAVMGSAMMGAALEFRTSGYAGEKWYELKAGDVRLDLRPFSPFSGYLFIADLMKKIDEGETRRLTTSDMLEGLLGTNLRTGTGLLVMDELVEALSGYKGAAKGEYKIQKFVGDVAGGYFSPLRTITDLYRDFSGYKNVKDTSEHPLTGSIMTAIPGLEAKLPDLIPATRATALERYSPAVKHVTGLRGFSKTEIESEMDRIGADKRVLFKTTGHPDIDRAVRERSGKRVEDIIGQIMDMPVYKNASIEFKRALIRRALAGVRRLAEAETVRDIPEPRTLMILRGS